VGQLRLHGIATAFQTWSRQFTGLATSNTFPGIAALALVVIALSERRSAADPRFRMCVVAAAGCAAVSCAPLLPFYRSLHATIPLFQAVRVLAHIGQLVLLMIANPSPATALLCCSVAGPHSHSWPFAATMLLVIVNGEALRAPIGYTWFDGVPEAL
jgi:hypothetical protein